MSDIVLTLPDLTLPENLAREAQANGLLRSESLASMVRAELRRRRVSQLFAAADRLAALDQPLTESEIADEIAAVREAKRTK